jgi:hypothetical protein
MKGIQLAVGADKFYVAEMQTDNDVNQSRWRQKWRARADVMRKDGR